MFHQSLFLFFFLVVAMFSLMCCFSFCEVDLDFEDGNIFDEQAIDGNISSNNNNGTTVVGAVLGSTVWAGLQCWLVSMVFFFHNKTKRQSFSTDDCSGDDMMGMGIQGKQMA